MPITQQQAPVDEKIDTETDIAILETEMQQAVVDLNFEKAAQIRDRIFELEKEAQFAR